MAGEGHVLVHHDIQSPLNRYEPGAGQHLWKEGTAE